MTSERVKAPQGERDERGRFRPGVSGNKEGKNQYSGRKAFQNELLEFIDIGNETEADRRAIWRQFIRLCKAGDAWAVRMYLERRWPPREAAEGTATLILRDYSGLTDEEKAAIEEVRERRKREGRDVELPEGAAPPGSTLITTGLEAHGRPGSKAGKGQSRDELPPSPAGAYNGGSKPNGESEEPEPWRSV
jgi:hypothetical protein